MSRRRVSVRELGAADCEGWLHRRKEGRSFLGSKWKKYWFVLKKNSLYWYTDKKAERAEGFIHLAGFSVQQATECRRKHALKASHPQVVSLFIAAETFTGMKKWISKLSAAAQQKRHSHIDTGECYSESSDQDSEECVSTEQETTDSGNGDVALPRSSSSPLLPLPASPPGPSGSRSASESGEPPCWLLPPAPQGAWGGGDPPLLLPARERGQEEEEEGEEGEEERGPERDQDSPPDEMERLYVHLKRASLSPIGQLKPSNQRDFRASFIRRCQNDKINEKLHLLRILNSSLKAKAADLQAVERLLEDRTLSALTYRRWRLCNLLLLQEMHRRRGAAGGAAGLQVRDQDETETETEAGLPDQREGPAPV
ncbi:interactor protein for cytohesin exchange factors 1-like [Centroberyx affinis]|uniref:interactor protein for cytohesin exchange factors 1-like n=1 Tax=Centroberyx affinis TaxID=166261 RepID=UPI003A5B962F